jgi:hypothetical protein
MPVELLDSSFKYPSADIFSMGLTAYEICQAPDFTGLPLEGESWHDLRHDRAPPLIGRPLRLSSIIAATITHIPTERPSTTYILSLPEVLGSDSIKDQLLINAKPNTPLSNNFSSSMSSLLGNNSLAINTDMPFVNNSDEDGVVTPIGYTNPIRFQLPPVKYDSLENTVIHEFKPFIQTSYHKEKSSFAK